MGYSTGRKPWRSDPPRAYTDESRGVKQKLFYLGLVVVVVFGALTLQLARMQLVNGSQYKVRAENNRLREVPITPTRGLIYDRNGVPLVNNTASFAAAVVPADVPKKQEDQITITLQELTGVPAGDISTKIDDRRRSNDPFTPVVIKENLTQDTAFALREQMADLPGVRVEVLPRRDYPDGMMLSDIVGFMGAVNEDEYAKYKDSGYTPNDRIGKTGVELTYEPVLRGIEGTKDVETDASGRELRVIDQTPAKPGNNVVLSIDLDLQQKVTEYLQAAMGGSRDAAAVVLDVRTGEVLAMVSLPAFDSNMFSGPIDDNAYQALLDNAGKPLVNHAIAEVYPPGSTFKQITGTAALQEGVATAGTTITSYGSIQVKNEYDPSISYTFKDWAALGTMNFYRGVAMSSDVYFYYLSGGYTDPNTGREVFQGLGATRLAAWARKYGLGSPTGVDLPGEAAGNIPDPDWKLQTVGEPWTIGDTYNFGIGQGYVTATPLQMVRVTAAIANGGDVLVPHVVKEIRDANGNTVSSIPRMVQTNLGIDPRNFSIFREGMREAVALPDGTAHSAASKYVQTAGKTGTAEFGERRPDGTYTEHGWFTGFAPFDNPQIAVVVFLDQGNGAINAAPVGGKIFDYYFGRRNLGQSAP